jgi:hypothetical protein
MKLIFIIPYKDITGDRYMRVPPEGPRCPFCYHNIEPPKELRERKYLEFPLGTCEHCGAVYAFDVTGYNQGAAFIEALLFACNYDNYLAFSLSAGEDYSDAVVEKYDGLSHKITPQKIFEERYIKGVLIFVKLNKEFQEVTDQKVKARLKTAFPLSNPPKPKIRLGKFSKETVHTYVYDNKIEELAALAESDARVFSELQRMIYTPDEPLRWRIIEITGEVCKRVGEKRPDMISKFLTRLLQNAATSGASAWGAIETSGVIISKIPDLLGEYSEAILSFLKFENLWKDTLWAIGRIATINPDLVKYAFKPLCSFLENADPALRGHAAWALGELGNNSAKDALQKLETDDTVLSIYKDGQLKEATVDQLAQEAMTKLGK